MLKPTYQCFESVLLLFDTDQKAVRPSACALTGREFCAFVEKIISLYAGAHHWERTAFWPATINDTTDFIKLNFLIYEKAVVTSFASLYLLMNKWSCPFKVSKHLFVKEFDVCIWLFVNSFVILQR